jgi:gluconate 2-dehydrogenase gamma chain
MKNKKAVSRRAFLGAAGGAGVASWLRLGAPAAALIADAACAARAAGNGFSTLSPADAADLEAMAARIIPTTDTPGAREAGVIHFIDQAFAGAMSDSQPFVLGELSALNDSLEGRFAEHDARRQDEILERIENAPLFQLVHMMTIFGFFSMSKYGGNRDHVGWDLIGFEGHKGANQYPFGYYDREVHAGEKGGN